MSHGYLTKSSKRSLRLKAEAELERRRRQREQRDAASQLSFREFIKRANSGYQFYKHSDVLINVLQRVADGELKRVMIFLPPRHSKSETVSRLFSAYFLYRYPHRW